MNTCDDPTVPASPKRATCAAARARDTFMVRVGQVGRSSHRCEFTSPLFPLALILAADGTLAAELRPMVGRIQA